MCSCQSKVKKPDPTFESFSLTVVGHGNRVSVGAQQYVRLTVNNRLYELKSGAQAPMYDFEANALIAKGVPIWILVS